MSVPKQIFLVTGASSGIGYDTCYAISAASSNNHVIMGARNQVKGAKALQELQARKPQGTLSLVILDVTKDGSIDAAAAVIKSTFGHIDVLINNAGIDVLGPITRETLQTAFDTNVFGVLLLTNAVMPLLKASTYPKIINVSSELAEVYRMTKATLNMLPACQYVTLQEFGGTAVAYCPGFVVTDLSGDREEKIKKGAQSSETSALGILEIVEAKHDGEIGNFITKYGKQFTW